MEYNHSLKDELVIILMERVYQKNDPKYENWSYEYLTNLSFSQIDKMKNKSSVYKNNYTSRRFSLLALEVQYVSH